ncbi:Nre family DNA repair protein [Candidatus Bathyarchaeota archaeon]|nr:Nre family DNA repair protein [Candidatus Bathyarchaeota archaeon]
MSSELLWVNEFLSNGIGQEPDSLRDLRVVRGPSADLCVRCRGGRMLCGKISCPLLAKARAIATRGSLVTSDQIDGSTPPGVFVGRFGYPHVSVGPMMPPYHGDTTVLDTPELWLGKSVQDIVDMRYSLVRGKTRVNIFDAQEPFGIVDRLQELALSLSPAESEAQFAKRPGGVLVLSDEVQPFGPSAPLRSFQAWGIKADRRIEKAYYDRDLNATDAIVRLHEDGVLVTRIQRAFSMGMFGVGTRRKLVPTRWSITAVDSTVSERLLDEIKHLPTIDEFRIHTFQYIDNRYVVMLMPEKWNYESIEAWFPGTAWNEGGGYPAMMGDHEGYHGRTTYASIGGCYYACRLAIAEHLLKLRKQSSALVLREIHPGYILPVGVWNVRESVRAALSKNPAQFGNFNSALDFALSHLGIPRRAWIQSSHILKEAFFQRKISNYFGTQ